MSKRLPPKERHAAILEAAIAEAQLEGYAGMTRRGIAARADVDEALVSHYFGTMMQLRRRVMRAAINKKIVQVIAQGLAARDPQAMRAPDELKRLAAAQMVGT